MGTPHKSSAFVRRKLYHTNIVSLKDAICRPVMQIERFFWIKLHAKFDKQLHSVLRRDIRCAHEDILDLDD